MNIFDKPRAYEGNENYVFISYSHDSKREVYKILHSLNNAGVRFWYDDSLEHGVNWKDNVKEKILNASAVWFFFDRFFLKSHSLKEEILLVVENQKKYSPVYYTGMIYKEVYKAAIKEDFDVDEDIEDLIKPFFKSDITAIINTKASDFIDELVREAERHSAIGEKAIETYRNSTKKFVFIGKDSIFTKSIAYGIRNVFAEIDSKIERRYLSPENVEPLDKQLRHVLTDVLKNDYSGVIMRPVGEMSEKTFAVFTELCKNCPVIVCDIDISAKQRKELGDDAPVFIGSDFEAGGRKIGMLINRLCYVYGKTVTDVIICKGPKSNSAAKERSEAIIREVKDDCLENTKILSLETLNKDDAYEQIVDFLDDEFDINVQERYLIIYAGNDNVAYNFGKKVDKDRRLEKIRAYKKITIIGYDGIVGSMKNSILEELRFDYATIDAVPSYQGEITAKALLAILNDEYEEKQVKVAPQLIRNLSYTPKSVSSLSFALPLIKNAGLYIFDLDGTIADTETLHWEAYNVLMQRKFKIQLKDHDIKRYIGNSEISIYKMIEKDYHVNIYDQEFLRERLRIYLQLVEDKNLQPFRWVRDFQETTDNVPVLLLTSQVPEVVDILLTSWQLDELIPKEWRISAHNGRITKSEVFENPFAYIPDSAEIMSNHVVVFEDSEHVANLASSFGHTVIGIAHQYNKDTLKHCDLIINESVKNGLFVGLGGIDMVYFVDHMPPANEKIKTSNYKITVGGPALNAAIACAKLGGSATLVTGIGNSPLSTVIKNECEKWGIQYVDIMPEREMPNVSFVAVDMVNSYRTIVSGQKETSFMRKLSSDFFESFDYCLYDCNLPSYTKSLIRQLSAHNIPLVLDCGSWKDNILYALNYADVAISSEKFASPESNDIFVLKNDSQIKCVAQTRGGDNILFSDELEKGEIEVAKLDNVNTLGAGDVLHGAFCHYFFDCKEDFKFALSHASEFATDFIRSSSQE